MKGVAHLSNCFKYNKILTLMRKKKSRRDPTYVIKTFKKSHDTLLISLLSPQIPFFLYQPSAESSRFQSPAFAPKFRASSLEILVLDCCLFLLVILFLCYRTSQCRNNVLR